jgi:DnaK suppressor protein
MDQKAIREKLLQELKNLVGRSDRIEAHWRDEAPPADWSELAIHQENDEVIESLDERTQEQMVSIKQALRRMDAGEWDTCSDCGEEIQAARLEALPTTTLCVLCAEAREKRS